MLFGQSPASQWVSYVTGDEWRGNGWRIWVDLPSSSAGLQGGICLVQCIHFVNFEVNLMKCLKSIPNSMVDDGELTGKSCTACTIVPYWYCSTCTYPYCTVLFSSLQSRPVLDILYRAVTSVLLIILLQQYFCHCMIQYHYQYAIIIMLLPVQKMCFCNTNSVCANTITAVLRTEIYTGQIGESFILYNTIQYVIILQALSVRLIQSIQFESYST